MRNLQNPWKQVELVARKGKKKITCPVLLIRGLYNHHLINHMNRLQDTLSQTWLTIQSSLFSGLSEKFLPSTEKKEWVATLDVVHIEDFIYTSRGFQGGAKSWTAIARVVLAKKCFITCRRHARCWID